MINLNLKQKKIILIIILVIALITYYYLYTKNNTEEINNENLEITNNETQEESKEEEKIVVHITGAVNKEGIVELQTGARIADAIEKAGGAKENADIKNINLATVLEDGMKVHIPTVEETRANNENIESSKKFANSQVTTATQIPDTSSNTKKQGKININTATEEELDTLPGIGPSTAAKIIEYRKENGKFKNIEEIKEVSGIGDAKYEKIKELIII